MKSDKNIVHAFQASSVDELRASLPSDGVRSRAAAHFVALALNNPQILVAPFQLDTTDKKEIKDQLVLKAVELLSLPLDAIGIDYQVLQSDETRAKGIFVCFPKEVLKEYLSVLDEGHYVPVKIMPTVIAGIDSFLHQYGTQRGRICLLDFSKANIIYCAVFSNGQCDFLREIFYEDADEIEHEVVQSLRCACATGSLKKFDHVYFSGDIPPGTRVAEKVKHLFCENVTQGHFIDVEAALQSVENILSLDLLRGRAFSLKQRQAMAKMTAAALIVCSAAVLILGGKILLTQLTINRLRSSYTPADYQRAVELSRRLQHLENEQ